MSFYCSLEVIPNVKHLVEPYLGREMYTMEIASVVNKVAEQHCVFLHSALLVHNLLEHFHIHSYYSSWVEKNEIQINPYGYNFTPMHIHSPLLVKKSVLP